MTETNDTPSRPATGPRDHAVPRGIAQMGLWADDVPAAAEWYTRVFGIEPYFVRPLEGAPLYVEFRIGDRGDELGITDRRFAPAGAPRAPGGAVTSWHVDDTEAAFERLLSLGAEEYQPVTPRGEGFITASVVDPFGNVLGLIHSPHYLAVLNGREGGGSAAAPRQAGV